MTESSRVRRRSSGSSLFSASFFAVLVLVLSGCPQPGADIPEPAAGTGGDAGELLYPVFRADETENADGYELQIAASPDFSDTSIVFASGAALFETADMDPDADFTAGALYYWRARAYVGGKPGPWSSAGSFIASDPGLSDAESPGKVKFSGLPPEVRWTAPESAAAFHLQVSSGENFDGDLLFDVRDIREGRFSLGGLVSPGGRYFWRIRARGTAGTWGAWSPVFASFAPPGLSLSISGITATRAFMGVSAGSAEVVPAEAGLAWGPAGTAVDACSLVSLCSNGEGSLSLSLEGGLADLAPASNYTVRAYALCEGVVVYGAATDFSTSADYGVGDRGPAGGTVFYAKSAYTDGWRYLEAAPADVSSGVSDNVSSGSPWGSCAGHVETLTAIGSGKGNTEEIVRIMRVTPYTPSSYAALLCFNLVIGSFDDWFLPSRDEMKELAGRNSLLREPLLGTGVYWSSSESPYRSDSSVTPYPRAYGIEMKQIATPGAPGFYEYDKQCWLRIRPVRAF